MCRSLTTFAALILTTFAAASIGNTSLCAPITGTNCNQNDLADGGVAPSAAACCALCIARTDCFAWTWNRRRDQHCWLKKNCDGKVDDATCVSGYGARPATPAPTPPPPLPPAPAVPTTFQRGVSLGGWLVMEGWMFDQFKTPAENDFVRANREAGGDAFAIAAQVKHWEGYIPDDALDAMRALGITHVRIPIGYWIVEAPVSGVRGDRGGDGGAATNMRDVGFQHEGYVTGGIVHLEALLAKLKARGMRALIDAHAMPGGSSRCASYAGMQVAEPHFWRGAVGDAIVPCAGAGPYTSTRAAAAATNSRGATTWMEVGVDAVHKVAQWVVGLERNASLAGVVSGLEAVNEPGLGFSGLLPEIKAYHAAIVPAAQRVFREASVGVNVTVNFIGPNDEGIAQWLRDQIDAHVFDGRSLVVDFHNYYNWDSAVHTFDDARARVCGTASGTQADWKQYAAAQLSTLIGEWSNAIDLNSHATSDIDDPAQQREMRSLWADQVSLFESVPGGHTAGQYYWTIRQGSGWDPRPNATRAQLVDTAWNKSLTSFGTRNWNLGELARVGVVKPIPDLAISGVCACDGCTPSLT